MMSYTRHYFPELNFLLTRIFGDLDNDQLRRIVVDPEGETTHLKAVIGLADCRDLHNVDQLTAEGTFEAATLEEGQASTTGGLLAILVPKELVFGLARVYASAAERTRRAVLVSYSLDEALGWLTGNDDAAIRKLRTFIEQVRGGNPQGA